MLLTNKATQFEFTRDPNQAIKFVTRRDAESITLPLPTKAYSLADILKEKIDAQA